MTPKEGPRPASKLWLVIGLVLFTLALGLVASILSLRDRKWAALEARVEALKKELEPVTLERLPLGRTMTDGNAWDDYLAANPYVPGKPPRIIASRIARWLQGDPEGSRTEAESLISELSSSVDRIRTGVRRRICRPQGTCWGSQDVAYLCTGKARLLAEAGETREAVDLLVDVCLYDRDLSEAGSGGTYSMELAYREMREFLRRRILAEQDLRFLEESLRELDDHYPDESRGLRRDLLSLGTFLQQEDREDCELNAVYGEVRDRHRWRYCFSSRLQAADTFSFADDVVEKQSALKSKPWIIAGPGSKALQKEAQQFRDSVLPRKLPHLFSIPWTVWRRGELRTLRVAVHYCATGEILELEDPVGGKIGSRILDQSLQLWHQSLSGNPEGWTPKPGNHGYMDDMVIELPLRR